MSTTKIKIGVIIPTRGNREKFLFNCWRMLNRQTLRVHEDHIALVNDMPASDAIDITWRYRIGYDRLRNKGLDVIAFIEDDDYYAPDYLETQVAAWQRHGRPMLFGINYSIYYHIRLRKYFRMTHYSRSPAMSTLIKPDLKIHWPLDHDPYTDAHLYTTYEKYFKLWEPPKHICLGIKHGDGITGGHQHIDRLHRYVHADGGFLKAHTDEESFKFYNTYFDEQNKS